MIADEFRKFAPKSMENNLIQYICQETSENLTKKTIEIEDLAALLYLKARIEGFDERITINNVVIDEAQDFSLFQFFILKHILNTENFTILGDTSQGIYGYRGIKNWQELQDKVFEGATYLTLKQSYRTTIEIMNLANEVLKKGMDKEVLLAEPVVRHGAEPDLREFSQEADLMLQLAKQLNTLKKDNHKSIAVIGKSMDECQHIKKLLNKHGISDIPILTGDEDIYTAGVMIVPAYLAKGLEFDAVLIINMKESYKNNELDTKLLYVAMTRAMHRLFVYNIKGTITL